MVIDTLAENWSEFSNGKFTWEVPEGWGQGRSLFGGLSAAAAASLAGRFTDRKLRTMQAQLIGPIVAGILIAECSVLRTGKTTSFIEVKLFQEDSIRGLFVFVFVEKREGSMSIEGPEKPVWKSVDDAIELSGVDVLVPEFTKNVEMRFAYGGVAFRGHESASTGGYLQFIDVDDFGSAHQLALLDAWYPPIYAALSKPAFGSTVTWTAHLIADSAPGFHQFKYDTIVADGGFSTSVGQMWDSAGTYVGYTEQTVVVFD